MRCCTITIGQCPNEALYIVVYGCLDQHVRERPLCPEHAGEWLTKFDLRKWRCQNPCREKIAEMLICDADKLTTEWLNI